MTERVKERWEARWEAKSNLAEARRTGGELSDLYRLIVIGVILVVRVDVMIPIRAGWQGRERGDEIYELSVQHKNCISDWKLS